MEKIILMLTVCFMAFTFQTHAQLAENMTHKHTVDGNALLLKSKKQKTAAWILLAGGAGLFMVGESIIAKEAAKESANILGSVLVTVITLGYVSPDPAPVKRSSIAPVMVYSGLASLLGSLPLFIVAHKNKVQAKLFIKNQPLAYVPAENSKQMAIGINIRF